MKFLVFLMILSLSSKIVFGQKLDFSSCARMDVPGLNKVAQGLCITSCSVQNCGTGTCQKRGGRPTCVCSRCANGGNVPVGDVIGAVGRRG
ncbi:unnamed protein product [Caenorhabditis angaria]|uniref:Uncharacterized protein n=1 Tax=Caenorhabditis angaria TaxID=860376 RepID=A0A9P1MTP9_9PELO|nr:unnamed protein product [Caenorhabditis angaria]